VEHELSSDEQVSTSSFQKTHGKKKHFSLYSEGSVEPWAGAFFFYAFSVPSAVLTTGLHDRNIFINTI
jgi:hypothetical protein